MLPGNVSHLETSKLLVDKQAIFQTKKTPSMYFREVYSELADMESDEFDISEFTFSTVKD